MASNYKIFWTDTALDNLESALNYLSINWTKVELEKFKYKLSRQLGFIQQYPYMFPVSQFKPSLRKATLSKQVVVFYEVAEETIKLVHLFNTKQNIEKIK